MTLLVAPGIATSNKGITTSIQDEAYGHRKAHNVHMDPELKQKGLQVTRTLLGGRY